MREMKDSGISWIGEIPKEWKLTQARRLFINKKEIVGDAVDQYERLALTLNGVIKRSKEDSEGLQPEKFEGYQILRKNNLVFKMIDLENVNTSRVGLSPYTGLVSPAYIVFSNNRDDNRYPYFWFMSMYYQKVFNHLGGDGVRSALNAKDMLSLPIPNISESEQVRIADYLDEKCAKIDAIIEKQQEIIEKLKEYKLSVITEAVTKGLNPDVEMKDTGLSFVGRIPKAWNMSKMKYNAIEIGDGLHSTPVYDSEGEYYFINGQNIGEQTLVFNDKTDRLNKDEYLKYKELTLTDNTIFITLNGATYGKTSFYSGEKVLLGKSAGYITLKPSENKKYIRYYLQSRTAKTIMELSLCGSTIANLSLATLNNFSIPLPGISEQREIVGYLDKRCKALDDQIETKKRMIEMLDEYKKSLIYEVVTGKKEV